MNRELPAKYIHLDIWNMQYRKCGAHKKAFFKNYKDCFDPMIVVVVPLGADYNYHIYEKVLLQWNQVISGSTKTHGHRPLNCGQLIQSNIEYSLS